MSVLRLRCIVALWRYGGERGRNRQILTEHSVEVRSFLFSFTIGTLNLIDFECEEVFFVRTCRVFNGNFSRTNAITVF